MTPFWRDAALRVDHRRSDFDCGVRPLNDYLARYARQNHERGAAKTFVAEALDDPTHVLGYYSLSIASLAFEKTPEILRRGLGRYEAPVYRLARLAVALSQQKQRIGEEMLFLAARRCMVAASEVGGIAILIDANDEAAAAWYRRFGAVSRPEEPLSLLLSLATFAQALAPRQ